MSEMITIDARNGKLTASKWCKFCSYIESDQSYVNLKWSGLDDDLPYSIIEEFLGDQATIDAFKMHETEECVWTYSDKVQLICDISDFVWWQKQKNGVLTRLHKLFESVILNSANEKKERTPRTTTTSRSRIIKIAAGVQDGASIGELEVFTGTIAEGIRFMNKYNATMLIKTNFKGNVKFVVDYEDGKDLMISTNWKTLEEWAEDGKLACV